ncbi:divalent metal cation transporter [Bradyrhizobium sp. INPA01-394B]|jgi:NRAMP (natural resistance-associated macrophage protein)-like metal ion transporter|uniref:Metal ion (Mn2+/Fe2+) transporter (Nramp) family metal ion transporter n=2 Tax=Nitrobacteraceae TaxID=41294 RepID=K8P9D0_9BRAD|nr:MULTISPECIES: divalent metal cation transporter [Nitrobacteraceae]MAH68339.1 divalent metal cation transporter [Afipia sp.]OUX62484.1 MAG: divalent metal cation transporter [Afipia sp. TMED4]ABQ39150.1 Putative manganese transport protein [Bradyrhizobium sp. BTAi1]EKS37409.1 metal ion (Mn2+/Fe2+) transporter (Nramp) family metal ion transporter [Afipia broomeae ATCC 49717]MBC9883387.1 divalent metal cation transporter [Bradyrhizobium campsiandrae]
MSSTKKSVRTLPSPVVGTSKPRLLDTLGPGLITGASDDDPSGIATYSQAGAQFGYTLSWTMLLTYPLMAAVQMISGRIGRTTGRGLAGNLRQHYPNWLLQTFVALLAAANIINIGADLGAMADSTSLVLGGSKTFYVALFGVVCIGLQVLLQYTRYVSYLKWLTLALLAYVATLFMVDVHWGEALRQFVWPSITWKTEYIQTIVAVFGTTISPYLLFWQASQEAEDIRAVPERQVLKRAPEQGPDAIKRIELDTLIGMGVSNLIALAIILTTAATLNVSGVTDIETSAQAAEALRPIADNYAATMFALGVLGTGLLAIPVLAGSAAYAIGEARKWPIGLTRQPKEAKAFYATIVMATLVGILLNFAPINPIKALYWCAVINGIVAVPVMGLMMLMVANAKIMGEFTIGGWLTGLGWIATAVMAAAAVAMGVTYFM